MKIDKIIFSVSEEFSPFWNLQSYIWKEKIGIEPVCILWGDVKNTNMKDTYGEIIEKKFDYDMIKSFQLTWSKFYHTKTEPDTTWMIGDIDLLPMQREWFTSLIEDIPDYVYTHLAYRTMIPTEVEDPETERVNLPAYYHVAKGKTFNTALGLDECSWENQIKRVMSQDPSRWNRHSPEWQDRKKWSDRHGSPPFWLVEDDEQEAIYWLADEGYSSYRLKKAIGKKQTLDQENMPDYNLVDAKEYPQWSDAVDFEKGGRIRFRSKLTPDLSEIGNTEKGNRVKDKYGEGNISGLVDRVDRYNWSVEKKLYAGCMAERAKNNEYVDMHCWRPYHEQMESMLEVLSFAWGDDIYKAHEELNKEGVLQ